MQITTENHVPVIRPGHPIQIPGRLRTEPSVKSIGLGLALKLARLISGRTRADRFSSPRFSGSGLAKAENRPDLPKLVRVQRNRNRFSYFFLSADSIMSIKMHKTGRVGRVGPVIYKTQITWFQFGFKTGRLGRTPSQGQPSVGPEDV